MFEKWQGKLTDFKGWLHDELVLLNEPKWPNRIVFYIFFFACVSLAFSLSILLLSAFFPDYSFLHTGMNPDNARYMLSALVQSLAAVVAIVVTLSLVAIQLSAQSYSSRVIDVYRRTPDIWILISIYATTIFFGLATIKIIGTNTLPINGLFSLEFLIFAAYFLGFFAFICLIPYIWSTLALLNPSKVTQLLAEDITEDKIPKTEDEKKTTFDENDPLLPIIDIITASMMKYDHATVRTGANAIVNRIDEILSKKNEKQISSHICKHLKKVMVLTLKRKDEESFGILLTSLVKIVENAAKNNLEEAINCVVVVLREIGESTAENNQEADTESIVGTLSRIGKIAEQNKLEKATTLAIMALDHIGQKAVDKRMRKATEYAVRELDEIGQKAAHNKWKWVTKSAVESLGRIGRKNNSWKWVTESVVESLGEIGRKAAQNKWEETTEVAVKVLEAIDKEGRGNEWSKITNQAIDKINQKQNKSDDN